jgi:hypothetical protein
MEGARRSRASARSNATTDSTLFATKPISASDEIGTKHVARNVAPDLGCGVDDENVHLAFACVRSRCLGSRDLEDIIVPERPRRKLGELSLLIERTSDLSH